MADDARPPKPRKSLGARPRRAPGRPGADGPDLRARLLDAAVVCFSRHGIAATPLRAIAAEAGVNAALLHYYFGDKSRLQQAVVAERVLPAFAELRGPLMARGDDVPGLVATFVTGVGTIVAARPWLPALWVREVLCEGGALRELLFSEIAPQLPRMMVARFEAAQARGELDPELDPRLLMVSLVGLTMFPLAGAPVWRRIFGLGEGDAGDIGYDGIRRHALVLLDRGLGAR